MRLVGTGTLSVDVWCVGVGARTWRGCWSMISVCKYACVGDVNERLSVDVCMETELTRWNDGNPLMATNDVVVGCDLYFVLCLCLFLFLSFVSCAFLFLV